MPNMRPLDELPDAATVDVFRNQSMVWLRDAEGVEYVAPKWLWGIVEKCWSMGRAEAQRDMREALGFVEPGECDCCQQGETGKKEVASG